MKTEERPNNLLLQIQTESRGAATAPAQAAHARRLAAILQEWGADETLQAIGALAAWMPPIVRIEETAWHDILLAQRLDAQALTLSRAYRQFLQESPAPPLDLSSQKSLAKPTLRPGERRGVPLVLQRIHAFCAAYQNPDLAFLYAALLWDRFLRVRSANAAAPPAYAEEARLLLAPFLEMLGMRELRSQVDYWLRQVDSQRRRGPEANSIPQPDPSRQEQAMLAPGEISQLIAPLQAQLPAAAFTVGKHTQTHNSAPNPLTAGPAAGPSPLTIDVLVDTAADCYATLYAIHQVYSPVDGGLLDNISTGRINGYRCLSSTVVAAMPEPSQAEGDGGDAAMPSVRKLRVQFRIATYELDEVNRWGLAAYRLRGRLNGPLPHGWWRERAEGARRIAQAEAGALSETLYVFSPHGQLFRFHRGATVVDYAYQVHSDLADRCQRFIVNGVTAEPTTVLRHLDLVELEHDAHAPGPTQVWLSAARTSRARTHIQRVLKRRGQGVSRGRRIVQQALDRLAEHYGFAMPDYRVDQLIRASLTRLQLARPEDFYTEAAGGRLDAQNVLNRLFADELVKQVELPDGLRLQPKQISMAQCCKARLGEAIVGRAKRRGGAVLQLKVHRADCPRIADLTERPEDKIILSWRRRPKLRQLAQIELTAQNEDRLLGDAVGQIYAVLPHVNLHRAEAVARHGVAHIAFMIEAESRDVIDRIVQALHELPGRNVVQVRVMDVLPTVREDLASVLPSAVYNPYSRMPVHEREMFFGRKTELARISRDLQANVGVIWLRGQKRVGKTSLLLHLKRVYLEPQAYVPVYLDFQLISRIDGPLIFYEVASTVYNDLQTGSYRVDSQIEELGPPLRELFEHEPSRQLMRYLNDIQSRLGKNRLTLLLDEFSRTMDAWEQERLTSDFFHQWRGVMLNTPGVSFITVIQQRTYDRLDDLEPSPDQEPIWELLELGEQLQLRPLDEDDVRRLIEWPIQGVLEYAPEIVERLARLTGGSPFLIQAFCSKLVATMHRRHAQHVAMGDVDAICQEFMHPHESLFAHLLDLIQGIGFVVVQSLAELTEPTDSSATWAQLREALPDIRPAPLRRTLTELTKQDILVEDADNQWRFASTLFRQWLCANPIA